MSWQLQEGESVFITLLSCLFSNQRLSQGEVYS